jgi:hypothetical protein
MAGSSHFIDVKQDYTAGFNKYFFLLENGGLFGLGGNPKLRRGLAREHPYSR